MDFSIKNRARAIGLGKLLYYGFHRPWFRVRNHPLIVDIRLGAPTCILTTYKAYGDTLLLSAVARALSSRGNDNICIATTHRDLFVNNPDVHKIWYKPQWECKEILHSLKKMKFCHYSVPTDTPGIRKSPDEHIIAIMCREAGVRGMVDILPRLYLRRDEKARFSKFKEKIVVQSSIANAGWPIINKEWYLDRMQSFVTHISLNFDVIQVGLESDPPLDQAEDYRGKLSVREVAALLASSRAFIGMVGFLMHLARAVDCPAVIIYGGREEPWQTGYTCNENIYTKLSCSPCWREDLCPYDRECMQAIQPDDVFQAFEKLLDRTRSMMIDKANIE